MRVLLACQPIPGHLNPNLALAEALTARSHNIAFYTGTRAREAVLSQGHAFYPFQSEMDRLLDEILLPASGSSPASRIATQPFSPFRVRYLNETLKTWLLETVPQQVEDIENISSDFQPDVLVSDVTLMGHVLVLKERMTVPIASYSVLTGCTIPGKHDPPWGRGLPPAKTAAMRLRHRFQRRVGEWMLSDYRATANSIRARYGLHPVKGLVAEEFAKLPLFIVPSARSFDYYRSDLPKCVKYVGACVWTGGEMPEIPQWLRELKHELPVVHVTEGTIYTREPEVLQAAVSGLSGRPMKVIMTTGKHREPGQLALGHIGSNIRVTQFVPHKHLFEKTDVVVTTGGAGTVTTALIAGVPLVVVPNAWELAENAQRIVEAGAGIRLDPKRCSGARLRDAVETVLKDASYRENARRIGRDLEMRGGPARAVELLEELVTSETGKSGHES